MNNDRIATALKSLPREEAGPDFTTGVLRRIDEPPRRAFTGPWAMAAVTAAVVLALGLGWREWRHHQEQKRAVAQLEILLAEKQELEEELHLLRRLASEARPVVYLGGNERVDLVLDLARLKGRPDGLAEWPGMEAGPRPADLRPAELRPADFRPKQRLTAQRAVY